MYGVKVDYNAISCNAQFFSKKSINLIRAQGEGFKCRVRHKGLLSDSLHASSGVRQGCPMSPILFLITLDEVLRAAVVTKNRAIRWGFSEHQEDLDYADDICLLSKTPDMQYKLKDLAEESAKV